jgi:hypothetical protein
VSEADNLFGADHVQRYRETDGEVGHVWKRGAKTLLLTTKGRKTGNATSTPLIYEQAGDGTCVRRVSRARDCHDCHASLESPASGRLRFLAASRLQTATMTGEPDPKVGFVRASCQSSKTLSRLPRWPRNPCKWRITVTGSIPAAHCHADPGASRFVCKRRFAELAGRGATQAEAASCERPRPR